MQQPNTPSALICADNQDPQNYAGTLNSKPERLRIAVGADVHLESFNLCAKLLPGFGPQDIQLNNGIVSEARTRPSADAIVKFIENAKELICTKLGYAPAFSVDVAYEAGCLGYSLYKSLAKRGVDCVIMAPTTMATTSGSKVKTDKLDARKIADCLLHKQYSKVHVLSDKDEGVRDFIRMRDDQKELAKTVKQNINSFVARRGFAFSKTKWTQSHIQWLEKLEMPTDIDRETLDGYLSLLSDLEDRIKRLDARILEFAQSGDYAEAVGYLSCIKGISEQRALSCIVEVGDYKRFDHAPRFAAFLGLVPGEYSSGGKRVATGLTKSGNQHLRKELIEAAQCIVRGAKSAKGLKLKRRQQGKPEHVINYADKAVYRLKSKFDHMIRTGKKRNVAIAAVARELSGFIWGMMNRKCHLDVEAQACAS